VFHRIWRMRILEDSARDAKADESATCGQLDGHDFVRRDRHVAKHVGFGSQPTLD